MQILLVLNNDYQTVNVYEDGSAELRDQKNGRRWHMGPVAVQEESELDPGHVWQRGSRSYCDQYAGRFRGRREGDHIRFTVLGRLGAEMGTFTCLYRLEGPWLQVEILEVDPALPNLMFPPPLEAEQLVLPLGAGRLIRKSGGLFDRHAYRYPGHLNMRFFGGLRGAAGWIAILDEGHADAGVLQTELAATPLWMKSLGRWSGRRRVRYRFTEGGYVGIAKTFRAWAKEHGLFKTLAEKIAARPAAANLIGGRHVLFWYLAETFERRRFEELCEPIPERFRDRPEGVAVWTNFTQMRQIMAECKALGMSKGVFGLGGWEWGGVDERHPDIWPPEPALGLIEELKALCAERDPYLTYLCDQYADMYTHAPSFPQGVCRRRDGSLLPGGYWLGGQCYIINSTASIEYARRNWAQVKSLNPRAMYMDTTTATQFNESYESGHPQTRSQDEALRTEFMSLVLQKGLVLGSENGADFGVPFTDFTHGNVHEHISGESVPLWPLVYHDCVVIVGHVVTPENIENPAALARRRLDCLLWGYQSSMVITSAESWPRLRAAFAELADVDRWHARVGPAEMTGHHFLSADFQVEKTEFSTGDAILCNYAAEPRTVEGRTVPALGYVIL